MKLTTAERLVHAVHQIIVLDENKHPVGTGTGFLATLCDDGVEYIPVLVTNRHVLEAGPYIIVPFTESDEDGSPLIGHTVNITLSTASSIFHPNLDVDLAIIPIQRYFDLAKASGHKPFVVLLPSKLIPSKSTWESFDAIESITTPGYPKGLRDGVNNFPIVRQGITATPPRYDFMGDPCFLVDMPCFEGCSGSPVFIYNEGTYTDARTRSISIGSRLYLLGILYATSKSKVIGKLDVIPATDTEQAPVVPLYLNIGYAVKSSALLDFEPILLAKFGIDPEPSSQRPVV